MPARLPFPIVGIGASAGGLEAMTDFLRAMPPESGMAFVLVQHLPPERESLVSEILARHTAMPVLEVADGLQIHPNHVYVIRPGNTLLLEDGILRLTEPLEQRGHQRPVDDFFRSLADEQRNRAIAIILSGMGSNGTLGAESVKALGGMCIAQDPETAKFPSMPRNLVESGFADLVLAPDKIPDALIGYSQHPYVLRGDVSPDGESDEQGVVDEVVSLLRKRGRHDFTGYKRPTLLRRIARRMSLHQISAMADYARMLRDNADETTALADDLMINVTGFFRDQEAWTAFDEKVVRPLVARREEDASLRAWVSACSSGEEAYSLAILLIEAAESAGKKFDIKIFATDTAPRSLAQARAGLFPNGIETDVSPERLERFFEKSDARYQVKKFLRECVVFAPQNLLHDAPFSRLDICTCRNLLIYLEPEAQRRVLAMLHFGLREDGVLFLGGSETVNGASDLFEPLDRKYRIFRRVGAGMRTTLELPRLGINSLLSRHAGIPTNTVPRASVAQITQRRLLERYGPAAVVIDRDQHIVYFHGQTEQFLDQPRGEPTRKLLTLAREAIRGALRLAVQQALAENQPVTVVDGVMETPEGRRRIEISISPLDPGTGYFLVVFLQNPEPTAAEDTAGPRPLSVAHTSAGMEQELQRLRLELQTTINDLQSSNEEMRASHEEATSINEELQSTNEELETSKEELQSLNEELTTVNAQLQAKMEELEATTNDLSSLLSSTDIAVIFLDPKFKVRRFTQAVNDLFVLIPADIGRPLSDFARKFSDDALLSDARRVLEKLVPVEAEIMSESRRYYVRRILPYRTADDRIEGVVITFIDITRRKQAELALRENEERSRLILEGVREHAIFMLDPNGEITTWNGGSERVLGFRSSDVLGRPLSVLFAPGSEEFIQAGRLLENARDQGVVLNEGWFVRKDGNRFWGSGSVSALRDASGTLRGYVKILRDETNRRLGEEALKQAKRAAETANEAKNQFLAVVSHELRTPISAIILWTSLLEDQKKIDAQQLTEALTAIKRSAEEQRELIEDLVDMSRIVSGKLRLEMKDISIANVVSTAMETVRAQAKAKGVEFVEHIDSEIGHVHADAGRLQQVVSNLANNAVKFTPPGGRVIVELRRIDHEIIFSVSDTGQGIAPEFLPNVFNRFTRAAGASTRTESGLGLGLAIAREIVELHGGGIGVESPGLGQGATFAVRLPLPAVDGDSTTGASHDKAQLVAQLTGCRILLIEDVAATRQALSAVLHEAGAEVVAVNSAPAAWETFGQRRPDLIISDLGLPAIDGYMLIREIRASEASARLDPIPALALTAFAGPHVCEKAIENGFQECLTKPIEPVKLVSTLARLSAADRLAKNGHVQGRALNGKA